MENGNEPATKADLKALDEKIDQKIEMLRGEVNHDYNDLKETIRDAQTEVLKAFYGFAESNR